MLDGRIRKGRSAGHKLKEEFTYCPIQALDMKRRKAELSKRDMDMVPRTHVVQTCSVVNGCMCKPYYMCHPWMETHLEESSPAADARRFSLGSSLEVDIVLCQIVDNSCEQVPEENVLISVWLFWSCTSIKTVNATAGPLEAHRTQPSGWEGICCSLLDLRVQAMAGPDLMMRTGKFDLAEERAKRRMDGACSAAGCGRNWVVVVLYATQVCVVYSSPL